MRKVGWKVNEIKHTKHDDNINEQDIIVLLGSSTQRVESGPRTARLHSSGDHHSKSIKGDDPKKKFTDKLIEGLKFLHDRRRQGGVSTPNQS